MNESCHIWMSHITYEESCHIWMSHVTYETMGAIASKHPMEWLWSVGSIKLQVSYAKEPYRRDNILHKTPIILLILGAIASEYPIRTISAPNVANGSHCSKMSYLLNMYSLNMFSLNMYSLSMYALNVYSLNIKYVSTGYVLIEYVFIEHVFTEYVFIECIFIKC